MNLNSSPPPFPVEEINGDHDQLHQALDFGPYYQVLSLSSSTSASSHIFFNSTQDRVGFYHHQSYRPHHQEDDNYSYHGAGSSYEIKNRGDSGLKLTLWKNEDQRTVRSVLITNDDNNPAKSVSLKTKTKNPLDIAPTVSIATAKIEVQKLQPYSSSFETDLNSNSSSYNSNIPIRVCSDCHTTKTPLWRSGPKGPKSLCNACGIRQRKARRAMAAAANDTAVVSTQPQALKTKVQYKEKMGKNGHSSQFKKRCQTAGSTATASSGSSGKKKLGFEDFLINLSKKFSFQRVFPQDEKDAAMLLMALSSGLVHG